MTKQKDFKQLVRQRMKKTGERYAAARAQILAQRAQADGESVLSRGGMQGDVGALRNALHASGLSEPDGSPLTEATAFGLCGGVGFLCAVFEYAGHPPMLTIVARALSE